jgi:hypothetical protein
MQKIELLGDKLDLQLISVALEDLLYKIQGKGDTYETAAYVGALIEQVEEIKSSWEEN